MYYLGLLTYALLLIESLCVRHHNCIHDSLTSNIKLTPIDDSSSHRLLQNSFGPIRLHYIYNTTDISSSDTIGSNVIKIMDIINAYWQKVIEVDYVASLSLNLPADKIVSCIEFLITRSTIDNPIPNKDFGVFIQAKDDGDNKITAQSLPCAYSLSQNKPTWAVVHWNKQYMKFDPLSFQGNIHIGIHQMTHTFGFSSLLYQFFKTGSIVTIGSSSFITGPYINAEVTKQYACPSNQGMLLQANGGGGTALSHWARKTASNELMTASVSVNNPTISFITLALLEQTGWYRRIYKTYAKYINFGYKKGCSMLSASNCASNQYCKTQGVKDCDYDRTALGYCKNDSLSSCLYIKYYQSFVCIDPNYASQSFNQNFTNSTGQQGGKYSRCFSSNLYIASGIPSKYPFRCYSVICSTSRKVLTIKIGSTFGFCLFENQVISVKGYLGTLTCPSSFQAVCAVTRCPNQCNANGICLNGKCLCGQNYDGEDCTQLSSIGMAAKLGVFDIRNNKNCIMGSYMTVFGDCQLCNYGRCAQCNQSQCLICINGQLPDNNGYCF